MLALTASGLLAGSTARAGGGDLPVVGRWPDHLRGTPQAVAIQGDRAYCAMGRGLVVFDVSDPSNPMRLGEYRTRAEAVAVAGSYAYVVGCASGLEVLDVTNPAGIQSVGRSEGQRCWVSARVSILGNHAFTTAGADLQVIDIQDPGNPHPVGAYEPGGNDVALSGSYAYLATSGEWDSDTDTWVGRGLQVLDLSDPKNLQRIALYETPNEAQALAVSGQRAYLADSKTLHVLDLSEPTTPQLLGTLALAKAARIVASGEQLYVAVTGGEDFQIIDVSDPATPRYVGGYDGPGGAADLALWRDWVCLVGKDLLFLDVRDPAAPTLASRYDTGGSAMRVAASGDLAFVASDTLEIIDVSVPSVPRKVGDYQPAGAPHDVVPVGDLVYVLPYTGVEIVNLSNLEAPQKIGGYEAKSQMGGMAHAGEHLYVAALDAGLRVFDVSDPADVYLAGAFTDLPQRTSEVAVSANTACVAVGFAGIRTFDVSDPSNPQPLGAIDALDNVFTVAVSGTLAVTGDGHSLQVIDLSDPANPQRLGGCPLEGFANDVAVSGDFAYVAAQNAGLVVIDISDPANPRKVAGNAPSNALVLGVAVDGDRVYVAADTDGLMIFDAFPLPRMSAGLPQTPGGRLTLTVSGRPGHRVRLQRSDDLRIWEDFHEVTLGDDPASVEEAGPDLPSHRFYRAVKE